MVSIVQSCGMDIIACYIYGTEHYVLLTGLTEDDFCRSSLMKPAEINNSKQQDHVKYLSSKNSSQECSNSPFEVVSSL